MSVHGSTATSSRPSPSKSPTMVCAENNAGIGGVIHCCTQPPFCHRKKCPYSEQVLELFPQEAKALLNSTFWNSLLPAIKFPILEAELAAKVNDWPLRFRS